MSEYKPTEYNITEFLKIKRELNDIYGTIGQLEFQVSKMIGRVNKHDEERYKLFCEKWKEIDKLTRQKKELQTKLILMKEK